MGNAQDKGRDFPSGSNIRTADLYLSGGIGEFWNYEMEFSFEPALNNPRRLGGHGVVFSDTWIAYSGFSGPCLGNEIFVGRVQGNWFGLDNSNSGSWNPFLERSLAAMAFFPFPGLGVMTDVWWEDGAITLMVSQPDANFPEQEGTYYVDRVRDRLHGTARLTYSPVHTLGNVWHFGISGAFRDQPVRDALGNSTFRQFSFSAVPEARARNTARLVNTAATNSLATSAPLFNMEANSTLQYNLEAARQWGPLMLEGEYTGVYVHRVSAPQGAVRFHGWLVQGRYLLTGESHEYDVRDGSFGAVNPCAYWGALEIAARYDYLTLNNKDVRGGSQHNVTVGINWFVNKQVRLSANYIYASIHPFNDAPKRTLDILGMRCQIRFK